VVERAHVIAVDAMGGDHAPEEIVDGALQAAAELGVGILLIGREDAVARLLPDDAEAAGVQFEHADDVVAMDEDAASAARRKKDSSLVRCAQAVREGRAQAMVGAGNTGATMAAALLRMGRVRGIARPAIAVPIPVPGGRYPQLLIDGGSTVDCTPEWLAQFARMGREYARTRLGVDEPTVGLLSNGEEPGKGDELRKKTFALLGDLPGFQGNVEGRDIMHGTVDVIVTDGFTGNVVLKTLEGALRAAVNLVFGVLDSTPEAKEAGKVITPLLIDAASVLDPDETGGAVLLGIDGVCVVSHGSSSARAIVNAVRVADECIEAGVVGRLKEAVDAG
jgi:glycerol-3-phosphate acyltransferase PlsX